MLKFLSFSVSGKTHSTISKIAQYICWLAFIGVMGFFAYTGFQAHKEINSIGSDYSTVEAKFSLNRIEENTSRGKKTGATYHFDYVYLANEKTYTGSFVSNEKNADDYTDSETVNIAYSNTKPELSKRFSVVEKGYSLKSYILRMLFIFVLLGFFALLVFGFITEYLFVNKDAPPEEETDDE